MRKFLTELLEKILVILMGAMVLNVLWQVAARYLGLQSGVTDELARFLLIWVGLLGAGYAVGKRYHLAIDLLERSLEGAKKQMLSQVINVFILLFALFVMVVGGVRLVYITLYLGQISPALQVPLGYIYTVLPLSGIIIIIYSVLNIVELKQAK